MGLRPWTAHAQYDHARMLRHRDASGDRVRALDLLEQALATYRELGMPGYAAKVSVLVQRTGATG